MAEALETQANLALNLEALEGRHELLSKILTGVGLRELDEVEDDRLDWVMKYEQVFIFFGVRRGGVEEDGHNPHERIAVWRRPAIERDVDSVGQLFEVVGDVVLPNEKEFGDIARYRGWGGRFGRGIEHGDDLAQVLVFDDRMWAVSRSDPKVYVHAKLLFAIRGALRKCCDRSLFNLARALARADVRDEV